MNTETTIPTNHGNMTPEGIVDHLTYISYESTRDAGSTAESLKRWYANADLYEQKYQSGKKPK